MRGWYLFVTGVIALVAVVTRVLHRYANYKRVSWFSLLLVWVSWFLNFSIVLLLPVDLADSLHRECVKNHQNEDFCGGGPWLDMEEGTLEILWKVLYWTSYVLCWTALPLTQSYSSTGEFFVLDKIRAAIKENLIFYAVAGAIGLILLLIIAVNNGIKANGIVAVALAGANAWGLFLLMCFLGYALVEVPKYFWKHASYQKTLTYYHFLTVSYKENCDKTKKELETILKQIKKYSEKIQNNDPFRPIIDKIVESCPMEYRDIGRGSGEDNVTYDKLVNLHYRLKNAQHAALAARSLYINLMNRAFQLEDIVYSYNSSDHVIHWTFKPKRNYRFSRVVDHLEWFWHCYLHGVTFRLITLICACLSLITVWSEVLFNLEKVFNVELSIFALVLNAKPNFSFQSQWLLIFVPVAYMTGCSYWSLFKLRLFNIYRLIPHHQSDASSLLFNAIYIARLTAPIAYNYLFLVRSTNTAFYKVMEPMKEFPLFDFNIYFPIILIFFCIGTLFNLYTRFVMMFCLKRFQKYVFDEEYSEELIQQGKGIMANERDSKEKGLGFSIDTIAEKRTFSSSSLLGLADSVKKSSFPNFKAIFSKSSPPPFSPNDDDDSGLGLLEEGTRGTSRGRVVGGRGKKDSLYGTTDRKSQDGAPRKENLLIPSMSSSPERTSNNNANTSSKSLFDSFYQRKL